LSEVAGAPVTDEQEETELRKLLTPFEVTEVVEVLAERYSRTIDKSVYSSAITVGDLVGSVAAHLSE